MVELPPNATTVSYERAQLMADLVHDCPQDIGREIYLYCSVAKGYADKYSDIEVTFVVDEVQEPAVYENWLRSVGAKVDPATIEWGGGYTTKSWVDGIFIEAAWRPVQVLNKIIEEVSQAATIDHWTLVDAWHVLYATPLKDAPQLAAWKDILKRYPPELEPKLIADATRHLTEPHWYPLSIINAFPLAFRGMPMAMSGHLMWTIERALRILFAINHQWEPDYKWLHYEAERLEIKPAHLVERVNDCFMLPDLSERVLTCFQLLLDVLKLVPEPMDVSKEIVHVSAAMEPEQLLA